MIVMTGIFEDERFIPDRPVSIPQKTKVIVTIEEEKPVQAKFESITKVQIEEWAKAPEIQSLVGILKGTNLPSDIKISDIRMERLIEKYKI